MKLLIDRHRSRVQLPLHNPSYQRAGRGLLSITTFLAYYWVAYICAIAVTWYFSRGNPTSWFFDPSLGYREEYSAHRRSEAEFYIDEVESGNHMQVEKYESSPNQSSICVGVPTIARHGVRYFRTSVGSLVEGLDPRERNRMYLMPFIAQSAPEAHPAYREEWLATISDKILTYGEDIDTVYIAHLENSLEGYREKALFDYAYMMKACLNTGLPYMAIIEDDVLAMDGWFQRTMAGLSSLESLEAAHGKLEVYLRLFYTEQFLGWNVEEWPVYLASSLFALLFTFSALVAVRLYIPSTQPYLSNRRLCVYCLICLPLAILLFFASGRVSTQAWGSHDSSIREMPKYGCCAQGLVFSQALAEKLIPYYEMKKLGFADDLTEQYANEAGLKKYAIVPSVLQHVGRKSSKYDDTKGGQMSVAETIRSFSFERHNPVKLKESHRDRLLWM